MSRPNLILLLLLCALPLAGAQAGNVTATGMLGAAAGDGAEKATEPRTLRLTSRSVVRSSPNGRIVDIWDPDALLTSRAVQGDWVRISGHFPDDGPWQPLSEPLWVSRHYVAEMPKRSQPKRNRPEGIDRYIVVDKSTFELTVFEKREGWEKEQEILSTTVALGMDRCLPKEKGGRCYYTDPGEYQVRWKVHDPEGIEWCIPKFMEKEYASSVAAGKRCFRGSIGSHALNIGKSYAIHGTSNPASLGKRASHGCVRARNDVMERIYALMETGDKVYIVD